MTTFVFSLWLASNTIPVSAVSLLSNVYPVFPEWYESSVCNDATLSMSDANVLVPRASSSRLLFSRSFWPLLPPYDLFLSLRPRLGRLQPVYKMECLYVYINYMFRKG